MIYLVHHADALHPAVDPQRPLSAAGMRHAEELARRAQERGVKPAVIWHSGKLRARQTAEAFYRTCNPLAEFTAARSLQPTDPPDPMGDTLAGETRDVMIVGHMPHIARLYNLLADPGAGHAEFPLHGFIALEAEGNGWVERFRL